MISKWCSSWLLERGPSCGGAVCSWVLVSGLRCYLIASDRAALIPMHRKRLVLMCSSVAWTEILLLPWAVCVISGSSLRVERAAVGLLLVQPPRCSRHAVSVVRICGLLAAVVVLSLMVVSIELMDVVDRWCFLSLLKKTTWLRTRGVWVIFPAKNTSRGRQSHLTSYHEFVQTSGRCGYSP
jgi:hypothetical protein